MSFTAKYRSECFLCEEPIYVGQEVEYNWDRELQHVECPPSVPVAKSAICPRCFCEKPVSGICGVCDPE